MNIEKQKLELTWIGKENRLRLEPRNFLGEPAKCCYVRRRVMYGDYFDEG